MGFNKSAVFQGDPGVGGGGVTGRWREKGGGKVGCSKDAEAGEAWVMGLVQDKVEFAEDFLGVLGGKDALGNGGAVLKEPGAH